MKNKLLLTTALVGVAFAMPTMAGGERGGENKLSHTPRRNPCFRRKFFG